MKYMQNDADLLGWGSKVGVLATQSPEWGDPKGHYRDGH